MARTPLIRDPASWARDWGWVSPLRAARAVKRIRNLACIIRESLGEEHEGGQMWEAELLALAEYLDPEKPVAAAKRRSRRRIGEPS